MAVIQPLAAHGLFRGKSPLRKLLTNPNLTEKTGAGAAAEDAVLWTQGSNGKLPQSLQRALNSGEAEGLMAHAEASQRSLSAASNAAQFSASKMVNDYVYFLASNSSDGRPVDAAEFEERIRDILHHAQFSTDGAGDEAHVELSAQQSSSLSAELAVSQSELSFSAEFSASAEAHIHGEFRAPDGSTFEVDAEVQVSVSVSVSIQESIAQQVQSTDPLALDLDNDGRIALSGPRIFDIDRNGSKDRVAFASGADAFLALDRNGNGLIDDGGELFGDQYGAANGFAELAKFDSDRNGLIDANDAVYSSLKAVRVINGSMEQVAVNALGIASIGLNYANEQIDLGAGNSIAQRGFYSFADGRHGAAFDLLLAKA